MKRIGVLLDNLKVKAWQDQILQYIIDHPLLNLEVFVINNNLPRTNTSGFVYRSFQALDRKIFPVRRDAFRNKDLNIHGVPTLSINGDESRFSYVFSDEDIAKVKEFQLDVLIRFGFGILKGDILSAARYGVWSLHHGDNSINRGGPPGFWEVAGKEEITGVTLQVLSSNLDGGKVLAKSYTNTDLTSFNRNKNEVFWSGVQLFNEILQKLAENEEEIFLDQGNNETFYSYPLYKDPNNYTALKIHFLFWLRRIQELVKESLFPPQWFILYKFRKSQDVETAIFRYKKLLPPKGYDWADPFVIKNQKGGYTLFLEELKINTRKGHISYLEFDQNGKLLQDFPEKVLEEEYHLSYPFVFEENGVYYMIPESANSQELWLYEAKNFPKGWERKQRIFSNKSIYDATIFKHEGYWYLFGSEKILDVSNRNQYLSIYFSEDLFGEWTPHPKNPLYRDIRRARPAGRIFNFRDKIIRPSQIGTPKYGYGIQFNEIKLLTPFDFKEIMTDVILPKWEKTILATHTYNSVGGFSVIDAQGFIKKKN